MKTKQTQKSLDFKRWLIWFRNWWRPNEWPARLLGLSFSEATKSDNGLIMIQIDGLSKKQLEKAINDKNMPFLNKLLKHQSYRLHPLYTGLPSTTPSVQGELFYGVKQIVPSFSYFDREEGKIVRMYDAETAQKVEEELKEKGEGLLKGGSSYSNIYTGGAKESHFCAVSLGLDEFWKKIRPMKWILFIITHVFGFLRIAILIIWEIIIGISELFIGIVQGKNTGKELKFVPSRVAICILLRDLIVLNVKMDIARGLPIIHMNFFGYDEQAHRRGPSSTFAHWALKGIDNAIAKIYKAALHSRRRHYDVWIYSDHGQEDTISYAKKHNKTIQEAVADVFTIMKIKPECLNLNDRNGVQLQRVRYFGKEIFEKLFPFDEHKSEHAKDNKLVVTALGPIGCIYLPVQLTDEQKAMFARRLVNLAKIPMVLTQGEDGKVKAWNNRGEFILPDQASEIFGQQYPYCGEIVDDLISLCQNEKAGEFVFSGWQPDGQNLSFPIENGAHAGPGKEETNAFVLAPSDVISLPEGRPYLYTKDLREAAFRFFRQNESAQAENRPEIKPSQYALDKSIRIMTYNVHSCVGMDGKIAPKRIARVIARHQPDIVALQELDMNQMRTNGIDQPHQIARHLRMFYHFYPSIQVEEEFYGNAILSRFPIKLIQAEQLPQLSKYSDRESRGALWVKVSLPSQDIHIINTHLGLSKKERLRQIQDLMGERWLGHDDCKDPVVLCGDLNALPNSMICRTLSTVLQNAYSIKGGYRERATWMSHYPIGKIDHVFVSSKIKINSVVVSRTDLDKVSSDHLPLIVDIRFPILSIKKDE